MWLMSAPAVKARSPAPVSTSARISGSFSRLFRWASRASSIDTDSAFSASGRFSVRMATRSRRSRSTDREGLALAADVGGDELDHALDRGPRREHLGHPE